MRNVRALSLVVASLLAGASSYAQTPQTGTPYTGSSTIAGEPLDAARAKTMMEFNKLAPKKQNRSALTGGFCNPVLTQPTPSADQVQLALALVESEIAPILSFAKEGGATEGGASEDGAAVNYSIDFDLDHVVLRSSNPRYGSQANGLKISYPHETSSHVWFEAKGSGSVLFIFPPVRGCSVQFIVACPRTYSNARTLDESKLTVTGVRYAISSKSDGLFQAPTGEEAKVVASTLASSRVELPQAWSSENISKGTPSASVKIQKPLDPLGAPGKMSSVSAPFQDAVEAHLEFGTTTEVKRTVRSRSTVEVSPFSLEVAQPVRIERSDVPLNPGSCFVISRRKETHY
jgi:hypothetical protein